MNLTDLDALRSTLEGVTLDDLGRHGAEIGVVECLANDAAWKQMLRIEVTCSVM